jgi:hypothetical protein
MRFLMRAVSDCYLKYMKAATARTSIPAIRARSQMSHLALGDLMVRFRVVPRRSFGAYILGPTMHERCTAPWAPLLNAHRAAPNKIFWVEDVASASGVIGARRSAPTP